MKLVEEAVVDWLFDSIRNKEIENIRTNRTRFSFTWICLITSEFDVVVVFVAAAVVVVVG